MKPCGSATDPKDDKYLALAAAGRADVIVSSDTRHLLSMHSVARDQHSVPSKLPRPPVTVKLSRHLPSSG